MRSTGAGQWKNQMIAVIFLALSMLCLQKHDKNLHRKENSV